MSESELAVNQTRLNNIKSYLKMIKDKELENMAKCKNIENEDVINALNEFKERNNDVRHDRLNFNQFKKYNVRNKF